MDPDADEVEQQLLRELVQVRLGTDQKPGWRASVDAEKWRRRGDGAGCARFIQASRAGYADDRPLSAARPGVRKDFAAILRASRSVRGRIRQSVVQAHASRHGTARALSWPARSKRNATVAGSCSRSG